MNRLHIDFSKKFGKIKPMHAINNAPLLGANDSMFHYMGEAGIPCARLHDTGGAYGGGRFVDIHNIFRHFDADPDDPASYDFAFTDWLLQAIDRQGTKIFFRLGETIENAQNIKAYYIEPPKDDLKWARICEKIIAHYNEGWADGFHLDIEYWELWNEPDNYPDIKDNCMWKGTFERYLELYRVAAPYLKARFPNVKIGGFASCGFYALFENNAVKAANSSSRTGYFIECFEKFLKFASENHLPLDFFSWHSYSDAEKNMAYEKYVHESLAKYGFDKTESILNEWNPGIGRRGTLEDSAYVADMFMRMQNTTVSMLMYYDGQVHGDYQGLYNPITHTPFKTYYAFKAFNELYECETQVECTSDEPPVRCMAACGAHRAVMLTNVSDETCAVTIDMDFEGSLSVYALNETDELAYVGKIASGDVRTLGAYETLLLSDRLSI